MARRWHVGRVAHPWAWHRPGVGPGLCCWFGVEPPAGIEPATPSLPWNHQEPLCGPPFPQLALDRKGRSYRFSFAKVMRSLFSHVAIVPGATDHPPAITELSRIPSRSIIGRSLRRMTSVLGANG